MKNNDLHAQIATALNLAREDMVLKGWSERSDKILRGIKDDLMFIHDNYKASFQASNRNNQSEENRLFSSKRTSNLG